jgi:hypothetical protein
MDTRIIKTGLLVAVSFVLLGPTLPAAGATITATSCSASAVQTAINSAANGDTVLIPAGTCTWSSRVSLNASVKSVYLRGAGIDQTVISSGVAPMLDISGSQGYNWAFSDLTIRAAASGQEIVRVSGTAKAWRVHHVKVTETGTPLFVFTVSGDTYGVFDNLTVAGGNSGVVNVIGPGFQAWTNPANATWGTERAIYLENSVITMSDYNQGRFTIDCQGGGRYVLRHNTITNQRTGNHGLDTGGYASCMSAEIYSNKFIYTPTWSAIDGAIFLRGGSALIHNNSFAYSSGTWIGTHIRLANYRAGDGSVNWPACNGTQYRWNLSVSGDWSGSPGFGTSGSSKTCSANRMRLCSADADCSGAGTCSEFVDGQSGSGAYPCFMQVGRGHNNMSSPMYEWSNVYSGGQGSTSCGTASCDVGFSDGTQIARNRDFFDDTVKPGYTPYPHPHPFRSSLPSGTSSGTTTNPLAAPTNLRINQ